MKWKVAYDKLKQEMAVTKSGGIIFTAIFYVFLSLANPTVCKNYGKNTTSQLCLIRRWRKCIHKVVSHFRLNDAHTSVLVPDVAIDHEGEILSSK